MSRIHCRGLGDIYRNNGIFVEYVSASRKIIDIIEVSGEIIQKF